MTTVAPSATKPRPPYPLKATDVTQFVFLEIDV
jgi:hypothetical protein